MKQNYMKTFEEYYNKNSTELNEDVAIEVPEGSELVLQFFIQDEDGIVSDDPDGEASLSVEETSFNNLVKNAKDFVKQLEKMQKIANKKGRIVYIEALY